MSLNFHRIRNLELYTSDNVSDEFSDETLKAVIQPDVRLVTPDVTIVSQPNNTQKNVTRSGRVIRKPSRLDD